MLDDADVSVLFFIEYPESILYCIWYNKSILPNFPESEQKSAQLVRIPIPVEDLLGDVSIGFYQFGKSFEIILSCLHIRTCCLTMPDNGVNAGPFSKVVKAASTGFKRVFRCLVRGSARGPIQQITVNCSCLLAYDALGSGIAFKLLFRHPNHQQFLHVFMERAPELRNYCNALSGVIPFKDSFCLSTVHIVEVLRPYCLSKSATRTPCSFFSMISRFNSIDIIFF
ncbi:hypothetical protein AVEN_183317-1 [Araneus ventricosus]|uniref:Uncharacterized protein n=1 Tax=Araneus ventricosus TaxID=182803 RepID=A0A4Y2N2E1_ARAVE|nr:hypothetical protein AVEN_183317-1 [Araneus ventricosus]